MADLTTQQKKGYARTLDRGQGRRITQHHQPLDSSGEMGGNEGRHDTHP